MSGALTIMGDIIQFLFDNGKEVNNINTYIYIYIYIYVYIYVYLSIYIYVYTYIYAYMYLHIYIHIYMSICILIYSYKIECTNIFIQISGALTLMGDIIQVLFNNENGIKSNLDINTNISIENSDILIENNPNILENSINITENSINITENSTNIMENSMEIESKIENLTNKVDNFSNISKWSALTSRSCVEFLDAITTILLLSDNDKGGNVYVHIFIYAIFY
jgi:hypothetical protein